MIALTIQQLFTPAPATPAQVSPTTPGVSWLQKMMQVATRLQLQVTDWNSGGVARTIMTIVSWMLSTEDAIISGMAQGGFLDYAATGTVQYVDPTDGTTVITVPVTVDPSVNPGAGPGWLDLLADSGYNVQRIPASPGVGLETITNATGNSYTYQPGTYHVSNLANGLTYSNVGLLTIAAATIAGASIASIANTGPMVVTTSSAHGLSSGAYVTLQGVVGYLGSGTNPNGTFQITVTSTTAFLLNGSTASGSYAAGGSVYVAQTAQFTADIVGPGTSGAGTITNAITAIPGVSVTNLGALVGTAAESNVALAARCRLSMAARSPNGSSAAYQYFALSAYLLANPSATAIAAGALQLISQPITKVLVKLNTSTGVVQTAVRNADGSVDGVTDLPISGATNASPIVVTVPTFTSQQLASGYTVTISGVQGNVAANGTWTISVLSPTTFALNGSTGDGAYIGGGTVEGGDLGELDAFLQVQCVPGSVSEQTISAATTVVSSQATVYVTASYAPQVAAAISTALATYAENFPIGGDTLPNFPGPGPSVNVLDYDAVLGVFENALPQIVSVDGLLLNGGILNIAVGQFGIVGFANPTLQIIGV